MVRNSSARMRGSASVPAVRSQNTIAARLASAAATVRMGMAMRPLVLERRFAAHMAHIRAYDLPQHQHDIERDAGIPADQQPRGQAITFGQEQHQQDAEQRRKQQPPARLKEPREPQ